MKRWYRWATPYVQLTMGFGTMLPVLYMAFSFYSATTQANAAVPILQLGIETNRAAIIANKAEQDKNLALLNQKVDLLIDYFNIPQRKGRYQ